MTPAQIFSGVYALALGPVNVFYIRDDDALTLIDAGMPGSMHRILAGARELGVELSGIRNIVLTHCHPDHAGSLAALVNATGAQVWMHHRDAEVVRGNAPIDTPHVSPGLLNAILFRVFISGTSPVIDHTQIENEVADGALLAFGGGLRAFHTPGHSPGHLAFLLERDGGLLFAGDACSNMPTLGYSIVYNDFAEGQRSLARLAKLQFDAVCFGHGGVLRAAAARRFNQKWATLG